MTITRREFVRHCLAAVAALPLARNRTASALYESVHPSLSGNPIFPGWYADPEGRIFENEYWVFPTCSAPYDEQLFFDAFSSRDLVTWTKHPRVLRAESFSWVKRAVWAPSVVRKGGWRHCNIAKLNSDFTGFAHFDDGSTFREITPAGYVEGSWMFVKDGKYYFMWSEGGWTGPDYAVAYAIGTSPLGPFERIGKILQQDPKVATGAGHHSVLHAPGSERWYIVYHRRPLGDHDRNHRVVCIDEMHFDSRGELEPVVLTKAGVESDMPVK
jgi:beta-xylosidase